MVSRSILYTIITGDHSGVVPKLVSPPPLVFQSTPDADLHEDKWMTYASHCSTPADTTGLSSRNAHAALVTPSVDKKYEKIKILTSRRKTQLAGSIARIPTDKDVLAERGSASNNHKGHQFYWRLILELRTEYINLGKRGSTQKKNLAMYVANRVFENGGRFLMRADKDSPWYEMSDKAYIEKIQTALRDEKNIAESAREYAKHNFPEVYGRFIVLQQTKKDKSSKGRESKKVAPRFVQPSGRHDLSDDGSRIVEGEGSSTAPPPWLEQSPPGFMAEDPNAQGADALSSDVRQQEQIDMLASHPPFWDWHPGDDDITFSTHLLDDNNKATLGTMASPLASDHDDLDLSHSWIPDGIFCPFLDGGSSSLTVGSPCSTNAATAVLSPFHASDTRAFVPIRQESTKALFGDGHDDDVRPFRLAPRTRSDT
jgi:hypothetical protein